MARGLGCVLLLLEPLLDPLPQALLPEPKPQTFSLPLFLHKLQKPLRGPQGALLLPLPRILRTSVTLLGLRPVRISRIRRTPRKLILPLLHLE